MPTRSRLSLVFAVVVALLLALTVLAVGKLVALALYALAASAGAAGLVAIGAVVGAYLAIRDLPDASAPQQEEEEELPPVVPPRSARQPGVSVRTPRSVQVPPEYLAAVMRGAQLRHAAYRREATGKH